MRTNQITSNPVVRPRLSVIVPVYNEEDGVEELYRRTSDVCREFAPHSYELILVNDGSKDRTLEKIASIAAKDDKVVVLDLTRNYGHQLALTAGLEFCRGDRIFIIDADLQDPPELLGPMLAKMDEGYDVVYGMRTRRVGESWFKLSTARAFYRLLRRLSETEIAEDTGDFRLMSRRALDHLNSMPERFRFIRGMVSWIGLKQCPLPYEREPRFAGKTHYPLRKMLMLAIDAITSFSVIPLRVAASMGLVFGVLGLVILAYTIYAWAIGDVIQGWTSLAALVLILGSVQMLILGIFGEYLGRMYIEVKRRPLYIVNEIIGLYAREREDGLTANGDQSHV